MARLSTPVGHAQRVRFTTADQPRYLFGSGPFTVPTKGPSSHDVAEHEGHVPQPGVESGPRQTVAPSPHAAPGTPAVYTGPLPSTIHSGLPPTHPAAAPLVDLSPGSPSGKGGLVSLASPIIKALDPVVSPLIADVAKPLAIEQKTVGNEDLAQILAAGKAGGLRVNKAGDFTTPAVRQALHGVGQATNYLQKSARPDLSGLSPQERAVVPYVTRAHHEYPDVPSSVLMSDIRQESTFNPLAKSPADAQGLSQFIPSTAASYGVQYGASPQAQQSQVSGQAHYLHDLGFAKDPQAALSSYSGGYSASAYNNPVLQGAHDYTALDKPSQPTPQAIHQYQAAAADAKHLGLHPTSAAAAAKPWGGDLSPSLHPETVFVRADGRGMVHWAESALGTKEGSPRQLNINAKSGISPSEPWCAAFIAAGLRRRGVAPPSNPAYSGNYLPQNWPGAKSVGTDLAKAKPGDLVIFGANEHIGLYAGSGQIIAGNWGNEVAKYAAVSDSRGISAIVRPPYKGGKVAVHSAAALPGGSPSSTFGGVATSVAAAGGTAPEAAAALQASHAHPVVSLVPLEAPGFSAGPTLPVSAGETPAQQELAELLASKGLSTSRASRPSYA